MIKTAIIVYTILFIALTTGWSMEKADEKPKECFWLLILATGVLTIICGIDDILVSITAWVVVYLAYKAIENK